jgi:hypothetical protein
MSTPWRLFVAEPRPFSRNLAFFANNASFEQGLS